MLGDQPFARGGGLVRLGGGALNEQPALTATVDHPVGLAASLITFRSCAGVD